MIEIGKKDLNTLDFMPKITKNKAVTNRDIHSKRIM